MKNKMNFSLLTGSMLYAFGRKCISLFDPGTIVDHLIVTLMNAVNQALTDFGKGFEHDSKDPHTLIIDQKDALRDKYFNGLKSHIRTFLYSDVQEFTDAAGKLLGVIRRHGSRAASMGMDDETTAITGLISELREKWMTELSLLAAMEWIDKLDRAQVAFEEAVRLRNQQGNLDLPTITKYRPVLIRTLKSWFLAVELQYEATKNPAVKTLLGQIDDLIGRTMATAKAGSTRRENQDGSPEAGNPPAIDPVI